MYIDKAIFPCYNKNVGNIKKTKKAGLSVKIVKEITVVLIYNRPDHFEQQIYQKQENAYEKEHV